MIGLCLTIASLLRPGPCSARSGCHSRWPWRRACPSSPAWSGARGKTHRARRQLLQLELRGHSLAVVGRLDLTAIRGGRSLLELAGLEPDGRLDIEAIAHRDGALLLGLKSPLTASSAAVVLRLADPVEALRAGRVPEGVLSRWAALPALPGRGRRAGVPGNLGHALPRRWLTPDRGQRAQGRTRRRWRHDLVDPRAGRAGRSPPAAPVPGGQARGARLLAGASRRDGRVRPRPEGAALGRDRGARVSRPGPRALMAGAGSPPAAPTRGNAHLTSADAFLNCGVPHWPSRSKMAVSAVVTKAPAWRHSSRP